MLEFFALGTLDTGHHFVTGRGSGYSSGRSGLRSPYFLQGMRVPLPSFCACSHWSGVIGNGFELFKDDHVFSNKVSSSQST